MDSNVAATICMNEINRLMGNFPSVTSGKITSLINFLVNASQLKDFKLKGYHVHLHGIPVEYVVPIAEWIASLTQVLDLLKPTYKDFYERVNMCEVISFLTRLTRNDLEIEDVRGLIDIYLNSMARRLYLPSGETVFDDPKESKDEASEMVAKALTDSTFKPEKTLPNPWSRDVPVKSIPLIKRYDLELDPVKTILTVLEKNDGASVILKCPSEITKEILLSLAAIEMVLERLDNIHVLVVSKDPIGLKQSIFSWQVKLEPPTPEFLASKFISRISHLSNIPEDDRLKKEDMLDIFKDKEGAAVECFDSLLYGYVNEVLSRPLETPKESSGNTEEPPLKRRRLSISNIESALSKDSQNIKESIITSYYI